MTASTMNVDAVMQILIDVAVVLAALSVLVCVGRRHWVAASTAAAAVWILAVASNNADSVPWQAAAFATVFVTALVLLRSADAEQHHTTED